MLDPVLIDGRYELLASLASGGEAEVHRARDRESGAEVALRLALPGHAPTGAAQTLPLPPFHSGWVQYLGAGLDAGHGPYQVFELLEGETLRQVMEQGPLDPDTWLLFTRQVFAAVAALHVAGWAHGDLNASNLFRRRGDTPAWKLLELPFLRLAPTAHSSFFGDLHTMAPEQLEGHPADAAADVYALGCLVYYAASAHYPHEVGSSVDIAVARLRFAPEPLGALAPDFPAAWSGWIMSLLERLPADRPDAATAAQRLLAIVG